MSPTQFGPQGFLQHDARFGVLICRECEYAIQKSAIESHLLKHKIYRDQRQKLVLLIAQLDLVEPEDVLFPSAASSPVPGLPVIPGFRCQIAGCDSLCASQKRMKRHHSEEHSINDSESFSNLASPVKLQTFFRGTKIRYFEVARPTSSNTQEVPISGLRNGARDLPFTQEVAAPMALPQPPLRIATPPSRHPEVSVNLAALTYLHHFTTTTSLTLPRNVETTLKSNYWQTEAVSHALQESWLMCGLLAVSAYHSAVLEGDQATESTHTEQAKLLSTEFFSGWIRSSQLDCDGSGLGANQETRETSNRIRCILNLIEWASIGTSSHQPESFVTYIQEFVVQDFTIPSSTESEKEDAFASAARTLKARPNDRFSETFSYLAILPTRIAETLGRSEDMPDVMTILHSIAILVSCCAENFASEEPGANFMTMAAWLFRVPDRFHQMVATNQPAALILTACWAAILIKRAQHCGCWFLGNSAEMILSHVKQQVSENYAVLWLIEDMEALLC